MSRLEDENEEKLDERMREEYGSAGAACIVSITRNLVFISPSGHPFDASFPWEETLIQNPTNCKLNFQ